MRSLTSSFNPLDPHFGFLNLRPLSSLIPLNLTSFSLPLSWPSIGFRVDSRLSATTFSSSFEDVLPNSLKLGRLLGGCLFLSFASWMVHLFVQHRGNYALLRVDS
jgi:hypothetical protein